MSPLDAVAYGLERQRELLPSKPIDDLVNAVTVTDGSARRNLAARRMVVVALIATNLRAALASASARLGRRVAVPHPNARWPEYRSSETETHCRGATNQA